MADLKKIREMKESELDRRLIQLSKEINSARIDIKMGKLNNVASLRSMRKELAQLKTIIRERRQAK
ncbi:50S ribosomal protein L29 [Candidatus Saccharibacteria bacterium]|nr:50S ribosomal protein L29 [Candidatus Saccharibacteria bacterium]